MAGEDGGSVIAQHFETALQAEALVVHQGEGVPARRRAQGPLMEVVGAAQVLVVQVPEQAGAGPLVDHPEYRPAALAAQFAGE